TAGGGGHHAEAGAAAAVPIGHGRGGELVLGQHRGDIGAEMRCVVEVFDVGAVDAEDVADAARREVLDDVVDHPLPVGHGHLLSGCLPVKRTPGRFGSPAQPVYSFFSSNTFPPGDETSW